MPYKNKADQAAAAKRHYEANKQTVKNRAKAFSKEVKKRNRQLINDYLNTHPCVDCGNGNIIVLEFDHVRGEKLHNIADMLRLGYSINTIKDEIAKCEVRCANCHRIITHERRNK